MDKKVKKLRVNISLPADFLYEIDHFAGVRRIGRSAFICLACHYYMSCFTNLYELAKNIDDLKKNSE